MSGMKRRAFLSATAGGLGISGLLGGIRPASAEELKMTGGIARISDDLEPLVRFLEETPREQLIEKTAQKVQAGLSYRELLAALLLAGVRNVQPRPSVGFKFHAVLVVNSAHLASLDAADQDRWLPLFWAIDNFKQSQAQDENEGDWTLPAVDESAVPPPHRAKGLLVEGLENWDEAAADAAIVSLVRHYGADDVYAQLAQYAARDFRSIGHKAIYLANGFRTLRTIGWEYAEPVMRSLVYAMQNHEGDPNPAESDLDADRPGRKNRERLADIGEEWLGGKVSSEATSEMLQTLRTGSPDEASSAVVEQLNAGVSVQSLWDAVFASAGELLMRQPGIVALHAVTTTNALHHTYRVGSDDASRQYALLQNAAFLPMFREAARGRGALSDRKIDELQAVEVGTEAIDTVPEIFRTLGSDRQQASQQMLGYLQGGGNPDRMVDHARRLIFLKGNNSHDYKFSSAALEDYRAISPQWRDRYLAASLYQLRSATDPTQSLSKRIEQAIAGV